MAVLLSKLQETIVKASKAVTNAAEQCFADGLRFEAIESGITFTIDVVDDSAEFIQMSENVQKTPEVVKTSRQVETPASTQQSQSYGRSTESEVSYTG